MPADVEHEGRLAGSADFDEFAGRVAWTLGELSADERSRLRAWYDSIDVERETTLKPAIERIVRMNATGAVPALQRLAAGDTPLAHLAADAVDFLEGRRTPDAWRRWRADDFAP